MSNAHLAAVRLFKKIKGPARAVLMVLADHANDSGECWPSMTTIATECGFSRSTVKNSLRALKAAGIISWNQRTDSCGDLTSNLYRLTLGRARADLGRAGDGLGGAGDGLGVGQELAKGRAGAGHKAPTEAPTGSPNEASLFEEELLTSDKSIHSAKSQLKELAETIYQEYPRKVAKKPAIEAIIKALKGNDASTLLERVKQFAAASKGKDMQFLPYPATWFNEERFSDDPTEWKQASPTSPTSKPTPDVNLGRRQSPTNYNHPNHQ